MPTVYQRKNSDTPRRQWTQENLIQAIDRINSGEMGINEAARTYGIPSRTLRRRRRSGIVTTELPLGPQGIFGIENEKRLVRHIQRLEKAGFAPDRETIRSLAYQFAEKLQLKHPFNTETQLAGYDWLNSFLRRNTELSIRKSQGLSLARSEGMNREEANHFFDLLREVYTQNNMFNRPGNIFNMDETGFQINNEGGAVIASKGAKSVHVLTSNERGENVSMIACCSAEGNFLPPVLIFKGVREKKEFGDGLPPGSKVFMNQKSSYINSELFFRWLKEHFVPKKPPGRTVLILDGHTSHKNSLQMLDYAEENEITLVCLPSHTTQALQPLDRAFFKPLKHYYRKEARLWSTNHPGRKITRLQAGELIGKAWGKSASVQTGLSGFKATGIFPLNPEAIPDHFYSISDSFQNNSDLRDANKPEERPIPSTSRDAYSPKNTCVGSRPSSDIPKETPSKFLFAITPVPIIAKPKPVRRKQSAQVLTKAKMKQKNNLSESNELCTQQEAEDSEVSSSDETLSNLSAKLKHQNPKCKKNKQIEQNKRNASDDVDCVECLENYYKTKKPDDWVQCIKCKKWLHETCTMYLNHCNGCGREERYSGIKHVTKKLCLE